jgi:hypothetical protein
MSEFNIESMANLSDADIISQVDSIPAYAPESTDTDVDTSLETTDDETSTEEDTETEDTSNESEEDTSDDVVTSEEEQDLEQEEENDEEEDEDEVNTDSESDSEELTKLRSDLEDLFSPFAANGTQIKVDTVEEAKDLMRMGANYHKKMHMLKPNLRFLKTLEKNNLLDEDKINFLIDVQNGDKKAISKLMKDASIDPLDLETQEDIDYSPVKHTVSEESVNLDEVLERVQDAPSFKDTMDIVTNQWDSSSKEILVKHPARIEVLVAHKADGTFDRINAEVTKQRMLGKLPQGLSDIEAYEHIGSELMQKQATATSKPVTKVAKKTKASNPKKVATPKGSKPNQRQAPSDLEQLAKMSDEDFLKTASKYF